MQNEEVAAICKAIGDLNRLQIVQLLTHGERCACDILETCSISQPTLSHHMKILVDSGIVVSRKDGKWRNYSISEEGSELAKKLLDEITTVSGWETGCTCN